MIVLSPIVNAQSPEEVKRLMIQYKIENVDLWMSVYREESGIGTSNLARNHNNVLGMKHPRVRATTSIRETNSGFAKYEALKDCIVDLKLYQLYYLKGFSKEQTLKYLRETYNGNKNYLYKILGY